jgi:hypothetical protein
LTNAKYAPEHQRVWPVSAICGHTINQEIALRMTGFQAHLLLCKGGRQKRFAFQSSRPRLFGAGQR